MNKTKTNIVEEQVVSEIISLLKDKIKLPIFSDSICKMLNINPIIHNEKKILYNKLIFSEYNPQLNQIHIYLGSLKEKFKENYTEYLQKAILHEVFHFLCARDMKRFISKYKRKIDIEKTADIFARIIIERGV